jgi:signal transduction histidine kinase
VSIVVTDHGKGSAPEAQKKLFDAFYMEASGRAGKRSHGLGLWIVRRLADAHGGSVSLQNAPREGTTVRVALPRVCDASAPISRREALAGRRIGRTARAT